MAGRASLWLLFNLPTFPEITPGKGQAHDRSSMEEPLGIAGASSFLQAGSPSLHPTNNQSTSGIQSNKLQQTVKHKL